MIGSVTTFALRLVRPYWKWVLIVMLAMLVETATSLASPWPLKIVLDSVFDSRPIPAALSRLIGGRDDPLALLNLAAGGTVLIALLQAVSAYLGAFYAVSLGQWIAHDLRQSVYAHL
jgi:ABC-type multidrug transport system fused ATPase/permease subunit